ncbi:MAG: twin-arginine translocase subunit TatC [Candidatus Gastranaerophilales bacterium]|nr:twin-arginine translocase subunit TatC [Candidatus Gastranaerophilales bacterium]
MEHEDKDQSIIAHLEELRSTILRCLIAIAVVLPFVFYFSGDILDYLTKLTIGKNDITLNYFAPMEVFILQLKLSLLIDAVICFPYIVKNLWDFILPALYDNERKFIKNIVLSSSFLFTFGVLFCLFVIIPMIINFGISFSRSEIHAVFGISNVINLALNMALVFGLMFQIPLIVNMLIRWDIVSYEDISQYRPYVVVALLIFSALLTPPDIVSQVFLFTPTYLLFELGLLFSKKKNLND